MPWTSGQALLSLTASQDAAGDGWVELWVRSGAPAFVGFHAHELQACGPRGVCSEAIVFGGAGGAAEDASLLVSAGHAFVHGVLGVCLSATCSPIHPPTSGDPPRLLSTLSVALPKTGRVCLKGGKLHVAAAGAGSPTVEAVGQVCAPVAFSSSLGPHGNHSGAGARPRRRGVALVKTYKTGSSTLGALLHRYADVRALDVAVNAKALRHARALERHLHPGTQPKPNECLYEFHTFKPCGDDWVASQQRGSSGGVASGGAARGTAAGDEAAGGAAPPKPLQLVIDHSRWMPLEELVERPAATMASDPWRAGTRCGALMRRMRGAVGATYTLFDGATSVATASELSDCVRERAASGRGARRLAGPAAYREAVPGGLLVTIMRWPAARFLSAVEQFNLPQQTGVPCSRTRRKSGGRCYGMTCERDFRFSWHCLNTSVPREGMLATFVRCAFDQRSPTERAASRLADLDGMVSRHPTPTADVARAHAELRARLLSADAARHAVPTASTSPSFWPRRSPSRPRPVPPLGCRAESARRDIPNFRFVQESIANTLGWPLPPQTRSDDLARMLAPPGGAQASSRSGLRGGGGHDATQGGAAFATLALDWIGALASSLDVVLLSEHFDESLLVLARTLGVAPTSLLYISQKRRATPSSAAAAAAHSQRSPAAAAALSAASLANASAWPPAALLDAPDGPWLWPNELDMTLRANWLDALAYLHFNATLWTQVGQLWPGKEGAAALRQELASFRATRARLVDGCNECERLGAARCLDLARSVARAPPPHLCWSLRQDTRSWSEHFFKRLALRFDAAAAARPEAPPLRVVRRMRRESRAAAPARAAGDADGGAGVRTGNVNWWRCPESRAMTPRCARLDRGSERYSLWDCGVCDWR